MTVRLAVFGNPVVHSRSPDIHEMFGSQTGTGLSYEKVEVPPGAFAEVADNFLKTGSGFNVTLPCKHEAYAYADICGDEAQIAKAVNTISLTADGRVRGDNTDGMGLVTDLVTNLGWQLGDSSILLLGAGGAVSGVLSSLVQAAPARLHIHNRTMDKAHALADRFGAVEARSESELDKHYDIVINGTSTGLTGGTDYLPQGIVQDGTACYDMVYGKHITVFNQWCLEQADCKTADGLGMLVEQAALSFQRWFGVKPQTAPVIESLRASLKN